MENEEFLLAVSAYRDALAAYLACLIACAGERELEMRLRDADHARFLMNEAARTAPGGLEVSSEMHAILLFSNAVEAGARHEIDRLSPIVGVDPEEYR